MSPPGPASGFSATLTARLILVNLRLCLVEIGSNRTRSLITSFGIFLGVASLLGMLSFVRGFRNQTSEQLERMGGVRILSISALDPETREERIAFSRSPGLRLEQVRAMAQEVPNVEKVLPVGQGPQHWACVNGACDRANMRGVSLDHMAEYNYRVSYGRPLNEEDFLQGRHSAVIGSQIAERFWGEPQKALGKTIPVQNIIFTVVGVLETQQVRDWRSWHFLYPYTVYEEVFQGHGSRLGSIDIKVRDAAGIEATLDEIERFLLEQHRGVHDFDVELNSEKLENQQKTNLVMTLLLGAIASISLIVGGISIANIMFATIGERIREIGIRKSLGARKMDLFTQFLSEAILLCSIGAVLGAIVGSIPSSLPQGLFPFKPELLFLDYFLALGASTAVGIASGIVPALYAARMEPITALRYG